MATNSFLKSVRIRDKKQAQGFVLALERASQRTGRKTEPMAPVHEMTKEQIARVLGAKCQKVSAEAGKQI